MEDKNTSGSNNRDVSADELLKMLKVNIEMNSGKKNETVEYNPERVEKPKIDSSKNLSDGERAALDRIKGLLNSDHVEKTSVPQNDVVPENKNSGESKHMVYKFKKTRKNQDFIRAVEGRELERQLREAEKNETADSIVDKFMPDSVKVHDGDAAEINNGKSLSVSEKDDASHTSPDQVSPEPRNDIDSKKSESVQESSDAENLRHTIDPEKSRDAFAENSLLRDISIIKDNSGLSDGAEVPKNAEERSEEYSEYLLRAEQSKIDIKKRIIDAEAYVSDISSGKRGFASSDVKKQNTGNQPDEVSKSVSDAVDSDALKSDATVSVADNTDDVGSEFIDASAISSNSGDGVEMEPTDQTELPDFDETDAKLMYVFEETADEIEKKLGKEKAEIISEDFRKAADLTSKHESVKDSKFGFEYTSQDQTKEIYSKFRGCYRTSVYKILLAAILFIVTFLFENISLFGASLPVAFKANVYPVVNIMISLQLLVFCAVLSWRQIVSGVKAVMHLKLTPDVVTLAVVAFSALYHIVCLVAGARADLRTFNFPVALCVLLNMIYDFLNLRREIYSFNIVASKHAKYAMNKLGITDSVLERAAFGGFLGENSGVYKIEKTNFVDNFFARSAEYPKSKLPLIALIPAAAVISLIFLATGWIMSNDMYTGVTLGYITFMLGIPLSSFIIFSVPFFNASREAHELESAIIGEGSLEACSENLVVSFDDREVFPSYGVKVKSVKVYGDNRIDQIIYTMAGVFHKVGGSLSEVLDLATIELGHSEDVSVTEVESDGIEAYSEGKHIYIGKSSYLRRKGFIPVYDQSDENIEDDSDTSIMFMISDNEVAAKVYVEYVMDTDFDFLIKQMYKSDVCIGIRSFDPNINDEMLSRRINISKYPVKILKCNDIDDVSVTAEKTDSGIVSKNSVKNLLTTMSICHKVTHVISTSVVLMIFTLVVGMVVSGVILALGYTANVMSLFVALYHLFWIIPMLVISRLTI